MNPHEMHVTVPQPRHDRGNTVDLRLWRLGRPGQCARVLDGRSVDDHAPVLDRDTTPGHQHVSFDALHGSPRVPGRLLDCSSTVPGYPVSGALTESERSFSGC